RVNWSPLSGNPGVSAHGAAGTGPPTSQAATYRPVSAATLVAALLPSTAAITLPAAGHFRALIVRPQPHDQLMPYHQNGQCAVAAFPACRQSCTIVPFCRITEQ